MTDILAIPAEFDTILVWNNARGSNQAYEKQFLTPRPPLGPFTHHVVRTFAKTCSEGRLGLKWRDHLICAPETWNSLSAEENSILRQAADRDKQRYEECVAEPAAAAALLLLDETQIQATGFAPSAFDLFKNSPATRSRLFDDKQGPVAYRELYHDKAFLWLWGRIGEEEKIQWREEAQRRLDVKNADRRMKADECLVLNAEPPAPEESPSPDKRIRLAVGVKNRPSQEIVVADHNLTPDEKLTLESIPHNVRRWDRLPRAARSAYTLYYADRVTAPGSAHSLKNPHSPSTRAAIHADWQAADDETRLHFENLAQKDKEEHKRQTNEYNEWKRKWWDVKRDLLLRKVIDRWHVNASFAEGQNRVRNEIPRPGPCSDGDYGLPSLYYPVIRTDYSNDAVYQHLRHVLLTSDFGGDPTAMNMTFYDGLPSPSLGEEETDFPAWPSFAEDQRSNDYGWCKAHFENRSPDDLKVEFGELSFFRKEHIPIYSFGGHSYAIFVDSQSMKDGTIVFASMRSYDFVDSRPHGDEELRPDGAWEVDEKKRWYLSPRVQAADVVIQLVNLDIGKLDWMDYVQHRDDHGLDLRSDHEAQRWRGWQWAIEYIFGSHALEKVVGVLETIPCEACLELEDASE